MDFQWRNPRYWQIPPNKDVVMKLIGSIPWIRIQSFWVWLEIDSSESNFPPRRLKPNGCVGITTLQLIIWLILLWCILNWLETFSEAWPTMPRYFPLWRSTQRYFSFLDGDGWNGNELIYVRKVDHICFCCLVSHKISSGLGIAGSVYIFFWFPEGSRECVSSCLSLQNFCE